MNCNWIDARYVSEAEFVDRFLLYKINQFAVSNNLNLELQVEESLNAKGRLNDGKQLKPDFADLTIRLNGMKLCVLEAKIGMDPYHYDVVKQGHRYAAYGFPFFATCNPKMMILFSSDVELSNNALSIIHYDDGWVKSLLDQALNPADPNELYALLEEQGIIDANTADLYRDTWRLRSEEETIDTLE